MGEPRSVATEANRCSKNSKEDRMVTVRFSSHLRRFIDLPDLFECESETVRDLVDQLEEAFPGVSSYLLHENGCVRQHVNIFLDNGIIKDRTELSDSLEQVSEVAIMQALSGG